MTKVQRLKLYDRARFLVTAAKLSPPAARKNIIAEVDKIKALLGIAWLKDFKV